MLTWWIFSQCLILTCVLGSCFFIWSGNLCLLVGVSKPFTFNAIINKLGLSVQFCYWFQLVPTVLAPFHVALPSPALSVSVFLIGCFVSEAPCL